MSKIPYVDESGRMDVAATKNIYNDLSELIWERVAVVSEARLVVMSVQGCKEPSRDQLAARAGKWRNIVIIKIQISESWSLLQLMILRT